jgi:primosomal protein N' (replication factor Y)
VSRVVSVAVPVAVDRGFSYAVPVGWDDAPPAGARVLVPFGRRVLVGIVRPVAAPPDAERLRALEAALDPPDRPALVPDLARVCEWMQDYYLAPVGEVYRATLPGLLTNADARSARITEPGRRALEGARSGPLLAAAGELAPLLPVHARILDALAQAPTRGLPVAHLTGLRPRITSVIGQLEALRDRGLCVVEWEEGGRGPRTEMHYRRTAWLRDAAGEEQIQRVVGRSKQRRAVLDYLETRGDDWIALSELRSPFPRARELLDPLVQAGLVGVEERLRQLDPFDTGAVAPALPQQPTADQQAALVALRARVDARRFHAALLHGVTGSGKTEVYLQLIAHARARGAGAIVLVPEISLTPQLADRFRARFGDAVAVLHSGLTPRQRLDVWEHIRAGRCPIVIGARSALFAPIGDLGVIVVDEEHDPSFKQEEGVRYNARDVALVRAREVGACVVLGSATPSLETYEHARSGRYEWLSLRSRPTPRPLPEVEVLSLAQHRPHPETLLTARLRDALVTTVEAGEQAILFLNRRGYTTTLVCGSCGAFQQCPDCSAPSLTYHLHRNRMMCHLCGHIEAAPDRCRRCGAEELLHGGAGTERVELALARELPHIRLLRLDRDTSRGRRLLDVLASFRAGEADVLVGTQMLSKGHDFPGVTLVGILQGDHGLGLPDPRAAERTFQLLTQVAGRAGRGDRPGRVVVQAYAVEHPAIVHASRHDFEGFAAEELARRRAMHNPPFGHLALARVVGAERGRVEQRAHELARRARGLAAGAGATGDDAVSVLGPVPSPIERINRRTRWQVLLRSPVRGPLRRVLRGLRPHLGNEGSGTARTTATIDVDPQTLL